MKYSADKIYYIFSQEILTISNMQDPQTPDIGTLSFKATAF